MDPCHQNEKLSLKALRLKKIQIDSSPKQGSSTVCIWSSKLKLNVTKEKVNGNLSGKFTCTWLIVRDVYR